MSKLFGKVTLPSETNFFEETKEVLARFKADAIRDSDGTKLSDELKELDAKIYTTYFVARGHNDFIEQNMEECIQIFLMSERTIATDNTCYIKFLNGYFDQQIKPDYDHDMKKYWQVHNRTTNEVVTDWEVDKENDVVIIHNAQPYHEYTVNFLAYMIWDATQMYNHITNDWKDKPHEIPFDVRKPKARKFVFEYLEKWLKENPHTDVVRFTTFFYHFTLVFNNLGKEKFVDWFGYGAGVSIELINGFKEETGIELVAEDFVDEGFYNSTFRVPSENYKKFMDYQQRFVAEVAKGLVDLVHESGKEAMMFLGDNWIGTEPYGEYFPSIGLDAVVGSVGGGATLRLISEIPGVKYTEGRYLPYFFPDTFYEGNEQAAIDEAIENWRTSRRALMRKPLDRIGYGGYLSLAYKFEGFMSYVEKVCEEFREISDIIGKSKPYCGLKVAILNSWGKVRSWQTHMVAHALWYKQIYSYLGILESLSGMNVDVVFINFDDIKNGVDPSVDVIINAGDENTAFSGGKNWDNPQTVATLRKWVAEGHGLIGVGDPSAFLKGGNYFQLAQVFGVERELGFSLSTDKYFHTITKEHFITKDNVEPMDFGESKQNVYALNENVEILSYENKEIQLSAHQYGKGRAVYMSGAPFSEQNARILQRALYYCANKEEELYRYFATNIYCEVHAYEEKGKMAVVNNANSTQTTTVYDKKGDTFELTLAPCEIKWFDIYE